MIHHMASHGFPARRVAALLGVSESGYYAWRTRSPSPRALRRASLTRLILGIHQESGSRYGYRRVRQELGRRYGIDISHSTVEAVMRGAGIRGQAGRPREQTPQAATSARRRRWIVDVLTLTTAKGPLYTAVVLDTASHCLLGWSTAATAHRTLVPCALMAALTRVVHAQPAPQGLHEPLPACSFTERADSLRCTPVGATVGNRYDHAVVETFWRAVHRELHDPSPWPDTYCAEGRLGKTLDRFARQAWAAGPASPSTP
ncbi:hypothetical protein AQJ66_08315 [Streptomyces bungoensis]|uniref:HTH-like domain-containing protein n=2 Tax=Streptomyces bungoensis TaxID=285568 RepID=A0A101T8J0_9ACTN|nr:hypothetical protein AQJ66_08315 [Streptomyces bungoensis]